MMTETALEPSCESIVVLTAGLMGGEAILIGWSIPDRSKLRFLLL